ncbi:MAG: FAD-dependent oxidoreductase [Bacteroidetes bacterium]|nr:FAD-dependent oxidoreductase [Bacteroidota bacterium]
MLKAKHILLLFACALAQWGIHAQPSHRTGVLVIGGGTGGTAAALQSARMGVRTQLMEEGPWLGGMLSAAGVSATDGNHNLPSGLWNEFREAVYRRYGGPEKVATGWVSNTHFEPRVADSILKALAAQEPRLTVHYKHRFIRTLIKNGLVTGAIFLDLSTGRERIVHARCVVDATELGDAMASADVSSDRGMEASRLTGEKVNVPESSDIVQDITYTAILKDYGRDADCTLVRPSGYDPMEFDGCCRDFCSTPSKLTINVSKEQLMDYARLPNGKYLINWPGKGNDIYLNMISMNGVQREQAIAQAKAKTLRFIYFLQTQFGNKHLGLVDDEFPTADRLPLMPYHREGRRLQGLVRFDLNHISEPYTQPLALYRTGIAVGDYPVDHHHRENLAAPQHLGFYPVPSFNIPLGALIPKQTDGLIVAEKGISVSNAANGTTRLQPVVMLTGQAAGVLAALSVKQRKQPRAVSIREIQSVLLQAKAYLMPYYDVKPDHPQFTEIQRAGATGILQGMGQPYQWANRTWFYPDSPVHVTEVKAGLMACLGRSLDVTGELLTVEQSFRALEGGMPTDAATRWSGWGLQDFQPGRPILRSEFAVLLERLADAFAKHPVDHHGVFIQPNHTSKQ